MALLQVLRAGAETGQQVRHPVLLAAAAEAGAQGQSRAQFVIRPGLGGTAGAEDADGNSKPLEHETLSRCALRRPPNFQNQLGRRKRYATDERRVSPHARRTAALTAPAGLRGGIMHGAMPPIYGAALLWSQGFESAMMQIPPAQGKIRAAASTRYPHACFPTPDSRPGRVQRRRAGAVDRRRHPAACGGGAGAVGFGADFPGRRRGFKAVLPPDAGFRPGRRGRKGRGLGACQLRPRRPGHPAEHGLAADGAGDAPAPGGGCRLGGGEPRPHGAV